MRGLSNPLDNLITLEPSIDDDLGTERAYVVKVDWTGSTDHSHPENLGGQLDEKYASDASSTPDEQPRPMMIMMRGADGGGLASSDGKQTLERTFERLEECYAGRHQAGAERSGLGVADVVGYSRDLRRTMGRVVLKCCRCRAICRIGAEPDL